MIESDHLAGIEPVNHVGVDWIRLDVPQSIPADVIDRDFAVVILHEDSEILRAYDVSEKENCRGGYHQPHKQRSLFYFHFCLLNSLNLRKLDVSACERSV